MSSSPAVGMIRCGIALHWSAATTRSPFSAFALPRRAAALSTPSPHRQEAAAADGRALKLIATQLQAARRSNSNTSSTAAATETKTKMMNATEKSAASPRSGTSEQSAPAGVPAHGNVGDAAAGQSLDGDFRPIRHVFSFIRQGPVWTSMGLLAVTSAVASTSVANAPYAAVASALTPWLGASNVSGACVLGWLTGCGLFQRWAISGMRNRKNLFEALETTVGGSGTRTAVVTGASSGIGLQVAAQLCLLGGFHVIATTNTRSKEEASAALLAAMQRLRPSSLTENDVRSVFSKRMRVVSLQLEDRLSIDKCVAEVKSFCHAVKNSPASTTTTTTNSPGVSTTKGSSTAPATVVPQLDLLINNAGSMLSEDLVITSNRQEYHIDANFLGPFVFTEKLLPLLLATKETPLLPHTHQTSSVDSSSSSTQTPRSAAGAARIVYVSSPTHALIKTPEVVARYLNIRHTIHQSTAASAAKDAAAVPQKPQDTDASASSGRTGPATTSASTNVTVEGTEINFAKQLALAKLGCVAHCKSIVARGGTAASSPSTPSSSSTSAAATTSGGLPTTATVWPIAVLVNPGRCASNLRRFSAPITSRSQYWRSLLTMRTPYEASQGVINAALRDDVVTGGYYFDGRHLPHALSRAACDASECSDIVAWASAFTGVALYRPR